MRRRDLIAASAVLPVAVAATTAVLWGFYFYAVRRETPHVR